MPIEGKDQVTDEEARAAGGTVCRYAHDEDGSNSLSGRLRRGESNRLTADAEERPPNPPVSHQHLGDGPRDGRRNDEAKATQQDAGGNAQHRSVSVNQRAASKAGIRRRIGANHPLDRRPPSGPPGPTDRADDAEACNNCPAPPAAHRDRKLADSRLPGSAKRGAGVKAGDLQQSQIGGWIAPDEAGGQRLAIRTYENIFFVPQRVIGNKDVLGHTDRAGRGPPPSASYLHNRTRPALDHISQLVRDVAEQLCVHDRMVGRVLEARITQSGRAGQGVLGRVRRFMEAWGFLRSEMDRLLRYHPLPVPRGANTCQRRSSSSWLL